MMGGPSSNIRLQDRVLGCFSWISTPKHNRGGRLDDMKHLRLSLDLQHLKQQVSIRHVLASYGLDKDLRRQGDQLIGHCPLHGGDNTSAFRVHLTRGIWHCFSACNVGGDVVDLIRRIE